MTTNASFMEDSPNQSEPDVRILTFKEACEFLKMKPSRLYALTSAKEIPHFKIGNLLGFFMHELIAWLKKHHQGPPMS